MEFLPFKSMQPPSSHYGGEREQMLNLNQRLETYLNRVKLLDEENAKLAKEIQTLRRNHHGNQERRRFMDEELQCARREVDTMWKERVYAEVDVARLAEELQTLDLQLQRETQAHIEANTKAEQSRRELEEERRAQIWLTEKVNQLEHEMKSLIHTHQEEVANVEHMMRQTRVMPTMRPTVQQGPSLRELGEEYNQRAARAWQEAAEVYQGQLTRLEGSVNETRQRLVQVNQEKSESVMKLQDLDKELLGLHDLREHLESTVNQQRESHCRDIQMLQEHLGALESEKHVLAQKMDQLLQENRGLAQMKMSLNMEVATYRALLDNESLKGNVTLQKQPRNIYSKDAVFSPWGDHYQMSPSPKTTSLPPLRSTSGTTRPPVFTPTPIRYQKYEARREKVEISKEKVEDIKVFQQPELTPYPKVLKDGAVEHFRPQEVNEKVTYAEPLSPPDEHEKTLDLENIGDNWIDTVDQPSEEKTDSSQIIEAKVDEANTQLFEPAVSEESRSFSVKSEPMEKQNESEEFEKPQAPIDAWIEEEMVSKTEQPCVKSSLESSSNLEEPIIEAIPEVVEEASTEEVSSVVVKAQQETPSVDEEIEKPQELVDAWVEKVSTEDAKAAQEQVESSDSETHAFVEPNFDTKSSSLASEESLQNQLGDFVQEEFTFDSVRASTDDTSPPKEKLYPDGEEMDTWDSVMEQNQGLTADDLEQSPEECLKQHAEPEEDISAKEVPQQMQEAMPVEELQPKFEPEIGDERQKDSTKEDPPEKSEEEEQEDSQNVSVSWQTELEGDSYAQDNTLADTRPLIRYKSDDTDGNTQASHIDDIDDSSDGEQDKKVGEMGSGMWIEDQTRRFGTMEDLCEEAEGEVLDEEYDLEYLRKDGKEDKEEMDTYTQEEHKTQEEVVKTVVEEVLDTDKLVEQELENLTTEWYSTHFMHQQTSEKHTPQNESVAEEPIAWSEALEGMTETTDEEDFHTNETLVEQKSDEQFEEEPQQQKDKVVKEVEEEDKHNVSMVTQCKTTEDITELQESVLSSTSQELSFENVSFEQKEPENMREQAEEVKSIGQDMPTPAEEEVQHSISMVTHGDITEDITELIKESTWSSTSQEPSFENVSFEQKEPENMVEQAEEEKSIVQDIPTPVEEEDKHSVSMVTHDDTTEDITEFKKEPENMGEQAEEKESIDQDVLTTVEEEDKHSVSVVTHCDTTEDITELRKESVLSSTSQEPSFENVPSEQEEPENMEEQAEQKESIDQDVITKVEEEVKHSVSVVPHCDTTEDITEFRKEPEIMGEQAEEEKSIVQDIPPAVEEEDKHSISMVTQCDTTEDITELRKESTWSSTSQEVSFEQKEPENMGEQAEEVTSIGQDMPTPAEEEVQNSISMVTQCDTTEGITELRKEPESMGEVVEEKESIDQHMPTTVEEEDMHNVSMVTHDDTTEDITELRKEPENMGEQAEEKESIDQDVLTTVEEEDKHSVSMVTHCDTTEDITEFKKEPENMGEQAEEKEESIDQDMLTKVEEEHEQGISMVTHGDITEDITALSKESVLSSTSQEVSFEQKEPEKMVEQAEEKESIVQDIPAPVEEEDKHSVTMVTHDDTTEDITEFKKEPESMEEQAKEKESIGQDVIARVEEEDTHSISMVTHGDTTEDITESRKESTWSSTSQEVSFEQKEPENMGEQAEEKESKDQQLPTTVEEEDKHSVSVVTHGDTAQDITEFKQETVWSFISQEMSFQNVSPEQKESKIMEEQAEQKESIVQDIPAPVQEEVKHSVTMVIHCDTREDITEFRKEPESMEEQAKEKPTNVQDMLTENADQLMNENESNKLLLSSTVESVTSDNDVEMRDTTPEEIFMPEEADIEFPKALAPTEWEVLENPTENVYLEDKINSDLTSKGLCGDDKADHDSLSPTDEPLNMSPESVHEDSDLFIVKDSKELLKTNGKTSLDEMFSMNVSNDFWVSPLESGATYQPDDNKHAEWKLSFGDVESRETQELAEKTDMPYEQKEVTQIFTKTVIKAEIVHSEESEDDSEAMSSGEE